MTAASHQVGMREVRRVAGFTLLELLVVIVIIAILAGLLLPALARAKGAAAKTDCLSRLKQWGLGFYSYTDDNEDLIPREGFHPLGNVYMNNWSQVLDPLSKDVWYNALPYYVGVPGATNYAYWATKVEFYEPRSLFHCPSARFPKETASKYSLTAFFSLAMNSQLIESPNGPTISVQRIRNSNTVLFLDGLLDDEKPVDEDQARSSLGQPSVDARRFAGRRHLGQGNIIFADLSARSVRGEAVVQRSGYGKGGAIEPQVDIVWDPD